MLASSPSYRFRVNSDGDQCTFTLPLFVTRGQVTYFCLRHLPNAARGPMRCGHSLRVSLDDGERMYFELNGLAGYTHGGDVTLAESVRKTSEAVFGPAASERRSSLENALDRFTIALPLPDMALPSRIEQYIRSLTPAFPVSRGRIQYTRA